MRAGSYAVPYAGLMRTVCDEAGLMQVLCGVLCASYAGSYAGLTWTLAHLDHGLMRRLVLHKDA